MKNRFVGIVTVLLLLGAAVYAAPLALWRDDSPTKAAIVSFVRTVTDEKSPGYVPPQKRIAVFDNDGTVWCENPVYFQLLFAMSRIRALSAHHPDWKETQPYRAVLENDLAALKAQGKPALLKILAAAREGLDDDAFAAAVRHWLETAEHPRFHRPYRDLVYQPMLDLFRYLEANGFTVFIVSGGGIDFMRAYIPYRYAVPAWRTIGSYARVRYENGRIVREAGVGYVNNAGNKPLSIYRTVGIRPIFAAGNSDGDLQMLEYAAGGKGVSFEMYVHHTDAAREYAYDRHGRVGRLDRGLDVAAERHWNVVDMAKEWKCVFAFEGTCR
jgi:phosphoserine phosphatase